MDDCIHSQDADEDLDDDERLGAVGQRRLGRGTDEQEDDVDQAGNAARNDQTANDYEHELLSV